MKKISVIILLLLFTGIVTAQQRKHMMRNMDFTKIEQLEKAKLIEALNLDENTAIRFFARRNENQESMRKLFDQRDKILTELEDNFKSNTKNSDSYYKKTIETLLKIDSDIVKTKRSFINSLKDILSEEQIVKFMTFEFSFRKGLRESLMRQRDDAGPPAPPDDN